MSKKHVTLILTHKCNLSCTYCYEHCKTARSMSFEVARDILDRELNARSEFEEVEIDLFGGEPFLAFETMKEITAYLRAATFRKAWSLSTITNGTVLSKEMKEWLADNSDRLECVLSYDGTPAMQDANRGAGTSSLIDCGFFREAYPHVPVKMTVSRLTLPQLAEGVMHLHGEGFLVNNSLANGVDWGGDDCLATLSGQLGFLIDFYLENPDVPECGMLQFPYEEVYFANAKGEARRSCDACSRMTCYDVDGRAFPCQQFVPMSAGGALEGEVASIEFPPEVVPCECFEEECRRCPLNGACQFCYGQNWIERGSLYRRDAGLCKMQKVIFRAKAYLAAEKWSRGLVELSQEDEKAYLGAIGFVGQLAAGR